MILDSSGTNDPQTCLQSSSNNRVWDLKQVTQLQHLKKVSSIRQPVTATYANSRSLL